MMKIKEILNDIRNYNLKKGSINKNCGITLISLVVTIIILLILGGIAIATLTGENGLFARAKQAKENYSVSSAKEKLQLAISDLMVEQTSKGENLTKEDLPKINNDEIDVKSTETFPVEVICENYIFDVDENFTVTYVREASGTVVTFTTEPESYTNKDEVKILVKISNPKGIKSIQKPGETDRILAQGQKEVGIDYKVTKNGHYIFTIVDEEGKETVKDIYIDLIDKLEPLDFTPEIQKDGSNITIIENGQDAESNEISTKSGIDYYEYYIIDSNNKEAKYETNEIKNLPVGNYKVYVIAYDRAGNSKKSGIIKFELTRKYTKISTEGYHNLAIDDNGNLLSWGGTSGYLEDGITSYDRGVNVNNRIPQLRTNFISYKIAARFRHSLIIDSDGNLWSSCIGDGTNEYGELGNGTTDTTLGLVKVMSGTKFINITVGDYHSLAIDEEGNLWAWGLNVSGQVGDGTTINKLSPVQIMKGTKFTQISAGDSYSLAIDNEGNLWTWGQNNYRQLGDGTTINKLSPVQIMKGTKFTQISAGGNHSLAIDEEGNLWAWGNNAVGQLGVGTTKDKTSPVQIMKGTKFTQISAGGEHSLAIDKEDNLWSWGRNYKGQLGDGTLSTRSYPIQIQVKTKFVQIAAGRMHSLAIDEEGKLWGWGSNSVFELGYEAGNNYNYIPTQIN